MRDAKNLELTHYLKLNFNLFKLFGARHGNLISIRILVLSRLSEIIHLYILEDVERHNSVLNKINHEIE